MNKDDYLLFVTGMLLVFTLFVGAWDLNQRIESFPWPAVSCNEPQRPNVFAMLAEDLPEIVKELKR